MPMLPDGSEEPPIRSPATSPKDANACYLQGAFAKPSPVRRSRAGFTPRTTTSARDPSHKRTSGKARWLRDCAAIGSTTSAWRSAAPRRSAQRCLAMAWGDLGEAEVREALEILDQLAAIGWRLTHRGPGLNGASSVPSRLAIPGMHLLRPYA